MLHKIDVDQKETVFMWVPGHVEGMRIYIWRLIFSTQNNVCSQCQQRDIRLLSDVRAVNQKNIISSVYYLKLHKVSTSKYNINEIFT